MERLAGAVFWGLVAGPVVALGIALAVGAVIYDHLYPATVEASRERANRGIWRPVEEVNA